MNPRKAIEKMYDSTCSIFTMAETKDGSITQQTPTLIAESIPCALSQKELKPTEQTSSTGLNYYIQKLFLSPDVTVPAGSRIEVNSAGRTYEFISSSEPFVYESHQEVMLQSERRA